QWLPVQTLEEGDCTPIRLEGEHKTAGGEGNPVVSGSASNKNPSYRVALLAHADTCHLRLLDNLGQGQPGGDCRLVQQLLELILVSSCVSRDSQAQNGQRNEYRCHRGSPSEYLPSTVTAHAMVSYTSVSTASTRRTLHQGRRRRQRGRRHGSSLPRPRTRRVTAARAVGTNAPPSGCNPVPQSRRVA